MNRFLDGVDRALRMALTGVCLVFILIGGAICAIGAAVMWVAGSAAQTLEDPDANNH